MLTAMQAAVVAAAAAWVIGVGVAVYVMLKAARLMSETSTTVAGLREQSGLLIERANAAIDRAGEQIAKTEAVTRSLEGVTSSLGELDGHLTALAPASEDAAGGAASPLAWAAALVYGVRRALGMRGSGRPGPAQPGPARPGPNRPGALRPRAALTGRAGGTPR